MVKEGMVTGIELDIDSKPEFCKPCIKVKADQKLFPKKSDIVYKLCGNKGVTDLWGPARVKHWEERSITTSLRILPAMKRKFTSCK